VQGKPGDFLLSKLIVNNTSANTIYIRFERFVKNLPPNWNSCFCFPTCLAPFIDTFTFSIAPFSMDSIMPNYNTDPIMPGIGYITIKLNQVGYPNNVDTIAFSGSTMQTLGISDVSYGLNYTSYPNPFSNVLTIKNNNSESYMLSIYNSTGENVYRKENLSSLCETIDLSFLSDGVYFMKSEFISGKIISSKIVKSNQTK
jgi:hypothetical protein